MLRRFPNLIGAVRKYALFLLGGLILLGVGGGVAGRNAWVSYHRHAAEDALEHRDFAQAEQHLTQCLKVRSNDATLHLLAAQTARCREAYAKAESHLRICEQLGKGNWETDLEWALLHVQQGDLANQTVLHEVLSSPPGTYPGKTRLILEALAQGYLKSYSPGDALQTLNLLLEQEPGHVQALCWRGRAWESLEQRAQARDDYQQAVKLDPEFAEARLRLASLLYKFGDVWDAAGHYEFLRQRQPDQPDVLLGLARCRRDLHELDAAREFLDTLLAEHLDHIAALLERAGLAMQMGQSTEGEQWFRRAASLAPNNREAHRRLYRCQLTLHKDADANRTLARLDEIEKETARVNLLIARAEDSKPDAAWCEKIGTTLIRQDRVEEGLAILFTALKLDPHYRPAHAALADYFQRTGQEDRAALHRK